MSRQGDPHIEDIAEGDASMDPPVQVSVEEVPQDDTQGAAHDLTAVQHALHDVDTQYRILRESCDAIDTKLEANEYNLTTRAGLERLQADHAAWLNEYEQYMDTSDKYVSLLDEQSKAQYKRFVFRDRNMVISQFKANIEKVIIDTRQRASHRDTASVSIRTSHASTVMSKRIKEEQHRAEIEAKMHALHEEEAIQMQELQLKMRRQKLQLATEHELSSARMTALKTTEDVLRRDDTETIGYDGTVHKRHTKPPSEASSKVVTFKQQHKPRVDASAHQPTEETTTRQPTHNASVLPDVKPKSLHHSDAESDTSASALASVAKLLKRPQVDIQKFNGDPTKYRKFIRQFNTKVASICDDDDERLTYLEQYTSGDAHKVVCGFSHLTPSLGYTAALQELKSRYGDEQQIANAYVQRALHWQVLKIDDVKGLDDYGIFLTECLYAITDVKGVDKLEIPENMVEIIKRVPYQFHEKWRSIVADLDRRDKKVRFKDVVDFVCNEAKKGRDVVYGRLALRSEPTPSKKSQSKPKGVYSTTANTNKKSQSDHVAAASFDASKVNKQSSPRKCMYCHGEYHPLVDCGQFSKVKYPDKIAYIKKNGLCFGCLKPNHMKKDCKRKAVCSICNGLHPTPIHVNRREPQT